MRRIKILHVSDIHFGQRDPTANQPRVTKSIVEHAHRQISEVDLCIVTGDLAFCGDQNEFGKAKEWLTELLSKWNCSLFIVPGNHDVKRPANTVSPNSSGHSPLSYKELRAASQSLDTFVQWRSDIESKSEHLSNFRMFHDALRNEPSIHLRSDWSRLFGFHDRIEINGVTVNVIGVNTAALSCANDDERKLVIDPRTLNEFLDKCNADAELVLVAAHHPLSELALWNEDFVRTKLGQVQGAHVYLHGHLHEAKALHQTDNGATLTFLGAGAGFQESHMMRAFALYELRMIEQHQPFSDDDSSGALRLMLHLKPDTYVWNEQTGQWFYDDRHSQPLDTAIKLLPAAATPVQGRRPILSKPPEIVSLPKEEAGFKRKLRENVVEFITEENYYRCSCYSACGVSCEEIVKSEILKSHYNQHFAPQEFDDYVEIVAFNQFDMIVLLEFLVRSLAKEKHHQCFEDWRPIANRIVIVTRDLEFLASNSAFSLERQVREVLARCFDSPKAREMHVRNGERDSIYVAVDFFFTRWQGPPYRVCFAIENLLDYARHHVSCRVSSDTRLGRFETRNIDSYLAALHSVTEVGFRVINLLNRQLFDNPPQRRMEDVASNPIGTSREALFRLSNVPKEIFSRLREAFSARDEGENLEGTSSATERFNVAADIFKELLQKVDDGGSRVDDEEAKEELHYWLNMEYAYCAMKSGKLEDLRAAEEVYRQVIKEYQHDTVSRLRLGQLLRVQREYRDAIELFGEAERILSSEMDERCRQHNHWVHHMIHRQLGVTYWRLAETRGSTDEDMKRKKDDLRSAIRCAQRALQRQLTGKDRHSVVNDLVYYSWEDRQLDQRYGDPVLPDHEARILTRELEHVLEKEDVRQYAPWDTLMRAHVFAGEMDSAARAAARVVDLLSDEKRAQLDEDERDAHGFAARVLADRFGSRLRT